MVRDAVHGGAVDAAAGDVLVHLNVRVLSRMDGNVCLAERTLGYFVVGFVLMRAAVRRVRVMLRAENLAAQIALEGKKVELAAARVGALPPQLRQLHDRGSCRPPGVLSAGPCTAAACC